MKKLRRSQLGSVGGPKMKGLNRNTKALEKFIRRRDARVGRASDRVMRNFQ
jgi:hypothetical protein